MTRLWPEHWWFARVLSDPSCLQALKKGILPLDGGGVSEFLPVLNPSGAQHLPGRVCARQTGVIRGKTCLSSGRRRHHLWLRQLAQRTMLVPDTKCSGSSDCVVLNHERSAAGLRFFSASPRPRTRSHHCDQPPFPSKASHGGQPSGPAGGRECRRLSFENGTDGMEE